MYTRQNNPGNGPNNNQKTNALKSQNKNKTNKNNPREQNNSGKRQ